MSRFSKRERLQAKAEYSLKQERSSALRMSHAKPERHISCDKYGNVYYKTTRDSTLGVKGYQEVVNKLKVEGPSNPLILTSRDMITLEDAELMSKTDKQLKKQDSRIRKLADVDQAKRNVSPMVRVGTIEARTIRVKNEDNELKKMRLSEKPRFAPVGLHSSVPKQS